MNDLDNKKINETINTLHKIFKIIFIFFIILLIYIILLINKELKITNLLLIILKIISPLFIGIFIAYLLNPIVCKLENKNIKRIFSCLIVYIIFILLTSLLMYLIVPNLTIQIKEINKSIPEFIDNTNIFINNLISKISLSSEFKINIKSFLNNYILLITRDFPNNCLNIINNTISFITCSILSIIISFYILFDFENFKNNIFILIPKKYRRKLKKLLREISQYIFMYIKGTFLIVIIVFFMSLISFSIFNLKAPIFFSLFNSFTNIIPYIGPIIGAIPIVLVSFMQNTKTGIIISISLVVIQLIENFIIQPILLGKTMKLHPVTILISLLIFGYFFGIIGMCIALPVCAIIKSITLFIDKQYKIFNFDKIKINEGRK